MSALCRLTVLLALAPCLGCWSRQANEVVVYTALDAEFAQQIFDDFRRHTGLVVAAKYDTESTKTVGLYRAIIAERARPRADLFWNNEILNTLRLERAGLLEPYASAAGSVFPEQFRSPSGMWHGFAARARILIVNTKSVAEAERPRSIFDLADPKWRGRVGIAKPLFGTTATHAACLFAALGKDQAQDYFHRLKANDVRILEGNKQVALSVAAGLIDFGLTDTDDAVGESEKGLPVTIVYPDQGDGELGTLFIPNTVSLIKGARHAPAARRLIDYLLSPQTEIALARGPSAQIPLNPQVDVVTRVATPKTVRPMQVDFYQAADQWETAATFIRDEFTSAH